MLEPGQKSNLFAQAFAKKFTLPLGALNMFSELSPPPELKMSGFLPIRTRRARHALRQLREDSATGPDKLSAKFLKMCEAVLALPVAILARLI